MKMMAIVAIVLVILIVIWLVIPKKTEVKAASDGKLQITQVFKITVADKTEANHFRDQGDSQAFYVDGLEAPTLVLKRGVYYEFKNESDEPLYFTSDPEGGFNDGGEEAPGSVNPGFLGLAKGSIYLFTSDDLPVRFYYQSGKHRLMGSLVVLK